MEWNGVLRLVLAEMLEEMLLLLVHLVAEVPASPVDDVAARVKVAMLPLLRRECIHRLVAGPATFSQLQVHHKHYSYYYS